MRGNHVREDSFCNRKFRSYYRKMLRGNRTAAELNHVANATRRRRRILQAGFFFYYTDGSSFKNSSVEAESGRLGLMEATI